jgi:hypothetical protein
MMTKTLGRWWLEHVPLQSPVILHEQPTRVEEQAVITIVITMVMGQKLRTRRR